MVLFIWGVANILAVFIIININFSRKFSNCGSFFYYSTFKVKTKLPLWICVILEIILDIIFPVISIPWYLSVITRFLKD